MKEVKKGGGGDIKFGFAAFNICPLGKESPRDKRSGKKNNLEHVLKFISSNDIEY